MIHTAVSDEGYYLKGWYKTMLAKGLCPFCETPVNKTGEKFMVLNNTKRHNVVCDKGHGFQLMIEVNK